jgi:antirestriction protein ArdC
VQANDLFAQITEQLIADIETSATKAWRMPWHILADAGTPTNVGGRPYRGINSLWLPMVAAAHDWTSGVWATYRGWQRHDAQVRRGAKATQVVLWKATTPSEADNEGNDHRKGSRRRLIARAYTVFAAEQVDGAAEILASRAEQLANRDTPGRIEAADAYFAAVGATVIEGGNSAYFQPSTDSIHVPALAQFDTAAHHAATKAHEHIHWTGTTERLSRDMCGRFGSDSYAAEELVAELGAAMWCAHMSLSSVTLEDHASYLAGWLRVLRADARALVTVASRAQAAVDYLNTKAGHTTDAPADDEQEVAA